MAREEKAVASQMLEDKKNSLPTLKKEWEKWAKKYEFLQNLKTRKEDIDKKKAEVAWILVKNAEEEVEEEMNKISVETKKIPLCDDKIAKNGEAERSSREDKKRSKYNN